MPNEYSLVSVPEKDVNAGRPTSKKSYLVIFDWDDVKTYKRDDKNVKVTTFEFLPEKKPIAVYATSKSQNLYHTSTGEGKGKGFLHHADFEIPGTELEVDEFFENNINRKLGVIQIPCNGTLCKIAGTPCQPMEITQDNSQDNSEANKHTVTMTSELVSPALGRIEKALVPATDNADLNVLLGLPSGGGI